MSCQHLLLGARLNIDCRTRNISCETWRTGFIRICVDWVGRDEVAGGVWPWWPGMTWYDAVIRTAVQGTACMHAAQGCAKQVGLQPKFIICGMYSCMPFCQHTVCIITCTCVPGWLLCRMVLACMPLHLRSTGTTMPGTRTQLQGQLLWVWASWQGDTQGKDVCLLD